jgi:FlaA1/EpsC-like NDP-sugar epimerase
VQTNVLGTKNLIEAAMQQEVEKLIVISTDKAVNPVNVLGASKLLAERLTISANFYKGKRRTVFSCVRFGNVLNSQGSVLPVFIEQISSGGPVKVTDEGMTRFVMSIDNAVKLVLKASQMAQGGETFILKEMAALRIKDLAEALIAEVAPAYGYNANEIKIEFIGKRDGEKLYEELMNEYEAEIAYETEDMFILSPFNNRKDRGEIQTKVYKSKDSDLMSLDQIRRLLRSILSEKLKTSLIDA